MGLVTKTQAPLIGVDISSTAVKLLQLARNGDRYRVEHYAVEPLPPNAVLEKNLVEVEAVGEAIRRAVARSGTKVKNAAAAVSGSSVITKVIGMPAALDEDELAGARRIPPEHHGYGGAPGQGRRQDAHQVGVRAPVGEAQAPLDPFPGDPRRLGGRLPGVHRAFSGHSSRSRRRIPSPARR